MGIVACETEKEVNGAEVGSMQAQSLVLKFKLCPNGFSLSVCQPGIGGNPYVMCPSINGCCEIVQQKKAVLKHNESYEFG